MAPAGPNPGPPLARPDPTRRAHDQGTDVHAYGRDGRGADDVAARDAGRRAQLGLPLHLDPGHHVHPAGAALAEPGLGGRRVHAVRGRRRADRGRLAADHVRDRRTPRPDGDDAGRPQRLRGRQAGAHRQRGLRPAAERRLRRGARLDPAPHPPRQPPPAAPVADRAVAGRGRHPGLARARPGDLGGPRQAAALRVLEADVLGRPRPRRPAGRDPRRPGSRRRAGGPPPRRSAPTSSSTGSTTAACSASTTARRHSTRPP